MRNTFDRVDGKCHISPFAWKLCGSFTKERNVYQQGNGVIHRLRAVHSSEKLRPTFELWISCCLGWSLLTNMKPERVKFSEECLMVLACDKVFRSCDILTADASVNV